MNNLHIPKGERISMKLKIWAKRMAVSDDHRPTMRMINSIFLLDVFGEEQFEEET